MLGGADQILPVSLYIPGCAVRPESIIDGILKCFEKQEDTAEADQAEAVPAAEQSAEAPEENEEKEEQKDE